MSVSALRIAFSRYALSSKAGRRARVCFFFPAFVSISAHLVNKSKNTSPHLFTVLQNNNTVSTATNKN
ncbi:hypothetical protein HMPREF1581_01482 [Gardnerella vaginalis JCP8108]|uniref:Uncharacterized protein n=1 Tax=Gardnerella vaginalis JCP8108 TaxID=1261066 RepID=S4GC75_GARVA|nr:hypothetical protein HMPREF1581_01482 [Gardnerella vaginalis JCP8108]